VLTLREWIDADADPLFRWMSDPIAVRMAAFTADDPSDRGAFDAWLARIAARDDVLRRTAVEDGEPVGSISFFTMEGEREITYWTDPARWGRGIATRMVAAALALEPIRPIYGRAASANLASLAVLRRAGFVEVNRDRGFAPGVGAEVEETILRLDAPA
jgi:RimJ/RimL family protein N-acetyltransferase